MFRSERNNSKKIVLPAETVAVLETAKTLSSHGTILEILSEAIGVSALIYELSGKDGKEVACRVENGKIFLYIDDGDGDDGEPITVEMTNIVELFKKAA